MHVGLLHNIHLRSVGSGGHNAPPDKYIFAVKVIMESRIILKEESRISVPSRLFSEPRKNKTLFVSPDSGGFIVLSTENEIHKLMNDILDYVNANENMSVKSLSQRLSMDLNAIYKATEMLFKKGMVAINSYCLSTTSSCFEKTNLRLIKPDSSLNISPVLCVFHLHNYCNLSCRYCYSVEEIVDKHKMDVTLMKKAVDEFADFPTNSTTFEFHGGEPLMAHNEIEQICEYALKKYQLRSKVIKFSIQTNGTLLSESIIKLLKKYNFSIRISIDGFKESHDKFRVTNAGKPTYDLIKDNIITLSNYCDDLSAVCVVHRENVQEMIKLYDAMNNLPVKTIRFLPMFKSGRATENMWVDGKTYFNNYIGLIKHILKLSDSGKKITPLINLILGELNSLMSFKRSYMCMRGQCGAGKSMISLDVNGDIYPCEEMTGKEFFKLGSYYNTTIKDVLENGSNILTAIKNRNVYSIDECKKCPWRQLCHAGCIHKSFSHYGSLDKKSDYCEYFKHIFRELIWLEEENSGAWKKLMAN